MRLGWTITAEVNEHRSEEAISLQDFHPGQPGSTRACQVGSQHIQSRKRAAGLLFDTKALARDRRDQHRHSSSTFHLGTDSPEHAVLRGLALCVGPLCTDDVVQLFWETVMQMPQEASKYYKGGHCVEKSGELLPCTLRGLDSPFLHQQFFFFCIKLFFYIGNLPANLINSDGFLEHSMELCLFEAVSPKVFHATYHIVQAGLKLMSARITGVHCTPSLHQNVYIGNTVKFFFSNVDSPQPQFWHYCNGQNFYYKLDIVRAYFSSFWTLKSVWSLIMMQAVSSWQMSSSAWEILFSYTFAACFQLRTDVEFC